MLSGSGRGTDVVVEVGVAREGFLEGVLGVQLGLEQVGRVGLVVIFVFEF